MKIVFMGTPDFAVGTLEALYNAGHEITAVFTQPDKPQGRKMILTPPPVKVLAEKLGLTVYQPKTLRDEAAYELLERLEYDLMVVVAYGKILPENILNMPKYGCMNIHGSILPKYRGAAPIQWSIICGETKTGVTAMYMDEGIDTGDIIEIAETDISESDTAETLFERLAVMGAELAVKTVASIENGTASRVKQNEAEATYAPIITKDMAKIDFTKSATEIVNLVRGLVGWPTAYFFLDGSRVKVYSALATKGENKESGTVLCSNGKLVVQAGNNTAVEFLEVAPEGKGKMRVRDMLNGRKIAEGSNLCG